MTKSEKPGQEQKKAPIIGERLYPELSIDDLNDVRSSITGAMIFSDGQIRRMSQEPGFTEKIGIAEEDLAIYLAHLTIAYRALRGLVYLVDRDRRIAQQTSTLYAVTGPLLVGPDGQPLKN